MQNFADEKFDNPKFYTKVLIQNTVHIIIKDSSTLNMLMCVYILTSSNIISITNLTACGNFVSFHHGHRADRSVTNQPYCIIFTQQPKLKSNSSICQTI